MTVIADNKKRVTIRVAKPGDRFDVQVSEDGRVVLTRLIKQTRKAQTVKPVPYKGLLVIEGDIDQDALISEIKADRDRQNARLLG